VKDLQERANDLPVHDVIAAIAGDSKAKSAINAGQTDPDPREFDRIPPDNKFLVLDADSSQQRAIAAVLADQRLLPWTRTPNLQRELLRAGTARCFPEQMPNGVYGLEYDSKR
jgi:hypothetical protein